MEQLSTMENQRSFLKDDRRLVCSMFVVYGLCILGAIIATIWGLVQRSETLSTNATSTAFAMATEQANATVTAAAHTTEQAQYSLINRFDMNNYMWRQGTEDNEYWSGYVAYENGVYVWQVKEAKDNFVSWADFPTSEYIRDFDVYVDTKMVEGTLGAVCNGLFFRKSPEVSQKDEYYYFSLCNDSTVEISYHSAKDGWENITSLRYSSYSDHWNRMEINARGSHFVFFINGTKIYEMDDDRRTIGGLALVIELNEKTPARIVFDNFGLQYR